MKLLFWLFGTIALRVQLDHALITGKERRDCLILAKFVQQLLFYIDML